jgi:hypothetical protein
VGQHIEQCEIRPASARRRHEGGRP